MKLAKMAGVTRDADHTYSIRSTWWLYRLANDLPFVACARSVLLLITWIYHIFVRKTRLSYFSVLSFCLMFFSFVNAAGCHCHGFLIWLCHWLQRQLCFISQQRVPWKALLNGQLELIKKPKYLNSVTLVSFWFPIKMSLQYPFYFSSGMWYI